MKLRLLFILLLPFLFTSCMSYYQMSAAYQSELKQGNIEQAYKLVDKNKFLKKRRNFMLKTLEQGKLAHLQGLYKISNSHFNTVDSILDLNKKNIGGAILGTLTNPENTPYKAEDFEKVSIHYYKALNYYYLGKYDAAIVEAKRINLKLQAINDKYSAKKKNRYKSDAFAHSLQGFIYESMGDINNAFIAYRNAAELYLKSEDHTYFGVVLPKSLKQSVLQTASSLGFYNEVSFYEKQFGMKYKSKRTAPGGELILLWEKGLVPVKDQTNFVFHMIPQSGVNFMDVTNSELGISIPIPVSAEQKKNNYDVINLAFAKYESRPADYIRAKALVNSKVYSFEEIEDYETIAFKTLEDRRLREITNAATRLATKKIAEYVVRKENEDLGTALSIFNALMEKADTRNWQTLPSSINYLRIPLKKGKNSINLEYKAQNGQILKKTIEVEGNGHLQIQNEFTF